eukprot:jgi/Botrbrau1/10495/Bobra.0133s0098.1
MVSTWTAVFPYTPGARYDANSGPCILQQQLRHVVRTALHPSHMCQRKCSSRLSINCSLATQQKISHAALPRDVWTYAWDADKSNTTAKVKVAVRKAEGCYQVEVMAEGTANGTPIEISWGLYRSDPRKWFSPAEVTVTPGTGEPDPDNPGASRSSLIQDPVGERPGPWIQVSIPAHLAPVTLAFRLKGVAPDIRNPKEGAAFHRPHRHGAGPSSPPGGQSVGPAGGGKLRTRGGVLRQLCSGVPPRGGNVNCTGAVQSGRAQQTPGQGGGDRAGPRAHAEWRCLGTCSFIICATSKLCAMVGGLMGTLFGRRRPASPRAVSCWTRTRGQWKRCYCQRGSTWWPQGREGAPEKSSRAHVLPCPPG